MADTEVIEASCGMAPDTAGGILPHDSARRWTAVIPLSRNRRFQALRIGAAAGLLGSSFVTIAAPPLILGVTGSAAQAGATERVSVHA